MLRQVLGVSFGVAVLVGNTILIGILRTPGDVAAQLPSPALFIGIWVIGGLFALLGAASHPVVPQRVRAPAQGA